MKQENLLKMEVGKYILTDNIYLYDLFVYEDKTFFIRVKGDIGYGKGMFIHQETKKDDNGKKYTCLSATVSIGGLRICSYDIFDMISKLKIFKKS